MNLAGLWDQLVDAVCRPPRDVYNEADLVGGRRAAFKLYNKRYYRQDVVLENGRGQRLQCSHYRPCIVTSADGRLPCVVYLHCNSGSRRDAEEILYHLLPKGLTVFCFDFAGSGLSDGGYVTLGAHEVEDLTAVVQYLRDEGSTSTIGLWGRSMGAVTALLFGQRDPSVAGMVIDSPFSRLVDLMLELATDQQLRIPKPLIKVALAMLKRSVRKRAGFSVDAVAPLDHVGASFIPVLFGHARDDTFVHKHHSERLFQAYAGDKNFISFEGDHNSMRPEFFYDSAMIFLVQALRVEELVGPLDLDIEQAPEDALPHLHPRGASIYVTAGSHLSSEELEREDEAAAAAAGEPGSGRSGAGSGAGSGASSPLHSMGSGSGRTLRPPWSLAQHGQRAGAPAAAPGAEAPQQPLAANLTSLEQLQEGSGQLAALLAEGDGQGLAAQLGGLRLSEEEALQRALELSLQEARQQGQDEQGEPQRGGEGPAAEAAAGARGGERPHTEDEEASMLAAAIAASLAEQEQVTAAAAAAAPAAGGSEAARGAAGVAAAAAGAGAAGAGPGVNGGGSSAAAMEYHFSGSLRPSEVPGLRAAAASSAAPAGSAAGEARPAGQAAGWGAAQAVADAHSAAEAAAAWAPAHKLQHALSDAADAAARAAEDGRTQSDP